MLYYSNQPQIYKNRAERRKNNIKPTPKAPKNNYNYEELECLIKRELTALINEPYSETLKREKYQRLQPLIEQYQKQQATIQAKTQNATVGTKKNDILLAYQQQKAQLASNPNYQKLNRNPVKTENSQQTSTHARTKKAIQAYQTQMLYGFNKVVPKSMETSTKSVNTSPVKQKKGFFSKIIQLFQSIATSKNKSYEPKATISKPSVKKKTVYTKPKEKNHIYNNFEKTLRDMRNYSQQNPTYKFYKNGRQVNLKPYYR